MNGTALSESSLARHVQAIEAASRAHRISVIICNYNYGRFLLACIESVTGQTRSADELIVVDDGSTDESRDLLAALQGPDRVILQDNAGQRSAINTGYTACTGDIVIFLDADDVLMPDALASIEEAWQDDIAKLHFPMWLIDADGRSLGRTIPRELARGDVSESFRKGKIFGSTPGSGNAYARQALERYMPLPLHAFDRHYADFFLIYGAAMVGRIAAIDRPLAGYRVHRNQHTIHFGNANLHPEVTLEDRGDELADWLEARLGMRITPPDVLHDFSAQKLRFAAAMFSAPSYLARLRAAPQALRTLLPSIVRKPETSLVYKLAQFSWALFTILAPLAWARPIAVRVCNPAAR